MVKLKGYRVTRNSSVTVDVNGQSKTFKHGDHVTFGIQAGGKQTLAFTGLEFIGYGQPTDFQGRDVNGKLVVSMPGSKAAVELALTRVLLPELRHAIRELRR